VKKRKRGCAKRGSRSWIPGEDSSRGIGACPTRGDYIKKKRRGEPNCKWSVKADYLKALTKGLGRVPVKETTAQDGKKKRRGSTKRLVRVYSR